MSSIHQGPELNSQHWGKKKKKKKENKQWTLRSFSEVRKEKQHQG
jgi:hypothetical protein